jgi:hypothetical protein
MVVKLEGGNGKESGNIDLGGCAGNVTDGHDSCGSPKTESRTWMTVVNAETPFGGQSRFTCSTGEV